jgi:hypothetical protein
MSEKDASVVPHHSPEPPEFEFEKGQAFKLKNDPEPEYVYVKARVWNYDADTDSEITKSRAYKQYVVGEVSSLGGNERLTTEGNLVNHYEPVSKEEAKEVI